MAKKSTKTDKVMADAPEVSETVEAQDVEDILSDVPDAEVVADAVEPDAMPVAEERPAATRPAVEPMATPAPTRGNRAGPLIFGGAIAAALGFGAAYAWLPKVDVTAFAAQSSQIADLTARLDQLASVDVEAAVASGNADAMAHVDALARDNEARLTDLTARMEALEAAPIGDGSLTAEDLALYQSDLATLRADVINQQTLMQDMVNATTAQLEQTRSEAAQIEQSATTSARNATARAALARLRSALESGVAFDAELPELSESLGFEMPPALSDVAVDGVASLATLQNTFPDAARAALAEARKAGVSGEENSGFTALIRNQFDMRSVEPREGSDTDAVLSRAEAAVRSGHLTDALAELATLPTEAIAELGAWIARAEARIAALDAVETLLLNQN